MKTIHFDYRMVIHYSRVVNLCHFAFKCIPKNTARQKLIKYRIDLDPSVATNVGTDSFDNIKLYGTISKPHLFLEYHITGEVEINQVLFEEPVKEERLGMYRYPYGKNKAGDAIRDFFENIKESDSWQELKSDYERAMYIMQRLHKSFVYEADITNIDTSAEEAFRGGKGVCQDYAHIYIALLHLAGIPARYVTGFMIGEGASHAWVEFAWRGSFVGVDPTNELLIDDNYIKIADGRDSSDCEINRGIIFGGGTQNQDVEAKVWKEEQ